MGRRRRFRFVPLALVGALGLTACAETSGSGRSEAVPPPSAAAALSAVSADGFARALTPRPFDFPADHGPHPDFAIEWWYFTGNLADDDGRPFGYQLTFFRRALRPEMAERSSAWATRQVYLAHFALTDIEGRGFHAAERTARGALGLAGAQAAPFAVWLESWRVASTGADATFPLQLHAADGSVALDLVLDAAKPPALNGDRGLSAKGSAPGNASYYYSMSRLPSRGHVTIDGQRFAVDGTSWLDREWSTSLLEPEQIGWDWFALQLDDGRDLMMFQLRRADGSVEPASHGSLIAADGSVRHLSLVDFTLTVEDHWRSPRGGRYPSRWRLTVPSEDLVLRVTPRLADQELDLSFRYWEGAVIAEGTADGATIRGQGYVELVGYGDAAAARDSASSQ